MFYSIMLIHFLDYLHLVSYYHNLYNYEKRKRILDLPYLRREICDFYLYLVDSQVEIKTVGGGGDPVNFSTWTAPTPHPSPIISLSLYITHN